MQVTRTDVSPTKVALNIDATAAELEPIKLHTLSHFVSTTNVPGFRPGGAPPAVLEKYVNSQALADEFMEHALNDLFRRAAESEKLRPVAPPKVTLKKFVPYTTLQFEAEVDVLGPINLPDYKKIKVSKAETKVTAAEVDGVVQSLQRQQAQRKEVARAAKDGDEVVLDFAGTDEAGKSISGADAKNYPLLLGSKAFIPGFEEELVGLKAGDEKEFTITFPADYGVTTLQNKKVIFKVKVHKVQELTEPKADNKLASQAGPFKTLVELKADIKKQLSAEKQAASERDWENQVVTAIADKAEVEIPESLVMDQILRAEEEEKRNLTFRGQTWQEHLDEEGITEEQHRERQKPGATAAIKTGLILGEVADREKIEITPEELEIRVQLLKGQYTDPQMQAELDKPANRADIASRLRAEKTLSRLAEYQN